MKIAGVVLAGGQSQRMGEDKANLIIDQNSLLTRAVNLLQEAGLSDCYVSGDYPEFNCIQDQHCNLGPIAGIAACASFLNEQYDAMLIIPVDMPLLAVQDCSHLLNCYKATNNVPGLYYQAAIFPILLALTKPLTDYLSNVVNSQHKKSRSLFRLFESLDIQGVPLTTANQYRFKNTNTPTQFQDCLATFNTLQQQAINHDLKKTKKED